MRSNSGGMRSNRETGAIKPVPTIIGGLVALVVVLAVANLVVRPGRSGSSGGVTAAQFTATAGPEAGTGIGPYAVARRAELARLASPSWALVSLGTYETVTAARRTAGSTEVGALLVATPGGFPATIGASDAAVGDWVSATKVQAASDAAGLRSMLPTAGDQAAADFRADLDRLAVVARVDGKAPIVFALLVHGAPDVLRALAGAPGVRLVDPTGPARPDLTGIAGLRPEETVTTGSPPTRPTG